MRKFGRFLNTAIWVLIAFTSICIHGQEVVSTETGQLQGASEGGVTSLEIWQYLNPDTRVGAGSSDAARNAIGKPPKYVERNSYAHTSAPKVCVVSQRSNWGSDLIS